MTQLILLCYRWMLTTASCSLVRADGCRVWFVFSGTAAQASFRFIRIFTITSCPFSAAHQSGSRLYSVFARLGLTSSPSKTIFTIPSYPPPTAHESRVGPDPVPTSLGLTSFSSKSVLAIPLCFIAARMSGIAPYLVSAWSGLTFSSSLNSLISVICSSFFLFWRIVTSPRTALVLRKTRRNLSEILGKYNH